MLCEGGEGVIKERIRSEQSCYKGGYEMETRIAQHPILGEYEKRKKVTFFYNGKEMQGFEGEPIAASLLAAGIRIHRYTAKRHEPRGIYCAIGRCTDCVMVVDGEPNVRTCITPLKEGMQIRTQDGLQAKEE